MNPNLIAATAKTPKGMATLFLMLFTFSGFSQSKTNVDFLNTFSRNESQKFQAEKVKAERWAERNNKKVRFAIDSILYELQYVGVDSIPQYYKTNNVVSAATISTNKVHPFGGMGLSLTGSGLTIREWDGGSALSTHQEFGARVTVADGSPVHYHATHVAGTMMAAGVIAAAKGMAYEANLKSFDWNNDDAEMATEAAAGALVSNHSYGWVRGWSGGLWYGNPAISTLEDYLFGFYDNSSKAWDDIANNAPYYLICKAAGNDRGNSGGPGAPYPDDGPYDCIGQQGVAKNILTVGAVDDLPDGYTGPDDVLMSSFSSWGPADDGRIKPDIVANGINLFSTYHLSDATYASMSGTSMATPSATGSLALLQQHYYNLFQNYMLAATLKALAIHTADEAGPDPGPDYMFGWGLMNTTRAANLITTDQNNDVISEHKLNNGTTFTYDVIANGTEPLKATIVWSDPSGSPPQTMLDPATAMLVNDLDLRITREQNTYYPWKLNGLIPANAATNNSENNVDNVEVVFIDDPVAGTTYTIRVDHDGSLTGGSQNFSLIVSGIESSVKPVANFQADNTNPFVDEAVNFTDLSSNIPTYWNWTISPGTYSFVAGTSASSQNPKVAFTAEGTYTLSLTAANAKGNDTETKIDYITVSNCGLFSLPVYESFEYGVVPPGCWISVDNDGDGHFWEAGSAGYTPYHGNFVAYSESYDTGTKLALTPDNWLISPHLSITTDSVTLKYEIRAQDATKFNENYSVLLSTTGNALGDFSTVITHPITAFGWYSVRISFMGYAGKDVYLAFRHWDCSNQSQLILDNIRIEEFGAPVEDIVVDVGETRCFDAPYTLTVAGGGSTVELISGSTTTFIAGENILFLPGFHAHSGCNMDAHITSDGSFCEAVAQQSVSSVMMETSPQKSVSEKSESETIDQLPSEKDVSIYPNPSTGMLHIELINFTEPANLKIYNQQGAVFLKSEQGFSGKAVLDLSHAPRGLYVVKVVDQNEFFTRIIILE
ncbi:MAG TPA: S8 family serine peptidase [Prolixibacteraceae bacterium]|nr:S8 family serine peptidase [Prolixibacteraceae bacterium]